MNEFLINFAEKIKNINRDTLLIHRIVYKNKNQFRRQRQFQILIEVRNLIEKNILEPFKRLTLKQAKTSKYCLTLEFDNKTICGLLDTIYNNQNILADLQIKIQILGQFLREMLKLKLFTKYCVLLLSILSRLTIILESLEKDKEIFKNLSTNTVNSNNIIAETNLNATNLLNKKTNRKANIIK